MSQGSWQLLISSAAGLVSLVTALLVLRQAHRHFRLVRSSEFIQRFNSDPYNDARVIVDTLPDADAIVLAVLSAEKSADPEAVRTRAAILRFVNLFQELGGTYRSHVIDREHAWRMFGYLSQLYWARFEPMILELRRVRNRPELYEDFQHFAVEMKRLDDCKRRAAGRRFWRRFRPCSSGPKMAVPVIAPTVSVQPAESGDSGPS